jgi:hypothetical protein
MSRWVTNFKNHQALQKVQAVLNTLQKANLESISSSERIEYERAIKVLKILEVRFSTLDPELFSQNTWGNFTGWLTNAQTYANTASQNLNSGHLQHLNNTLDEVLNVLRPIDIKFSENEVKALAEASAIYRQKIIEELDLVKKRADEIKRQFDLLSGEVSQGKVRLDKNDQIIESQKTRLDASIAEFQKQFSSAQETRNQDFQKLVTAITENNNTQSKAFDKSFKTASDARKAESDSLIADTKKQGNDHLEFLKKRQKEVDEIFGAIGAAAIAGNFNDIANRERTSANYWRRIAFVFFSAMGAVAIVAFGLTFNSSPNWETFVFRLGTVLVLAIPAFYAANESSKHREREKIVRKNFLELSAIDAYLVLLPEQQRNEIKGKLSERFFGVPEVHEKTEAVSKKDLLSLLEKAIKDFTKGH